MAASMTASASGAALMTWLVTLSVPGAFPSLSFLMVC